MGCRKSKSQSIFYHGTGLPHVQQIWGKLMKPLIHSLLIVMIFFSRINVVHTQEIRINCTGNTFTSNLIFPEERFKKIESKTFLIKDNKISGRDICLTANQYSAYCHTPGIEFTDTPGRYISISTTLNRINGQIEEIVTDHQPISMFLQRVPSAAPYLKGISEYTEELIFRGSCEQIKGQKF